MLRRFNTLRDRSFALRSLATALRSGITPVEALSLLHRGRGPPRLARACHEAAALLQQGAPVHQALTRGEPPLVDPREVPLLIAAEQSGALAEVLGTLADGAEQASRDLTAVIARLAYPVLVFHLLAFVNGLVAFAGGSSALLAILGVLVPGYALIALLAWLCASAPGQALVDRSCSRGRWWAACGRPRCCATCAPCMACDAGVGLPRAAELAARSVPQSRARGSCSSRRQAPRQPGRAGAPGISLLQDGELQA
ncbi:MAG: type II secretion system F family protein [Planctomycetota bacterium]